MDGIDNFRELGGLAVQAGMVRPGVFFRSGHLAGATDADLDGLVERGIRTVIDLRTDTDVAAEGEDRLPDGVDHHRVPIPDDAGRGAETRALIMRGDLGEIRAEMGEGRAHAMATAGAAEFVRDDERNATFGRVLALVADPDNWPVLWHCSAGKDRAGWVGTLVLLGLGAEQVVIVDHYVESNRHLRGVWGALFPDGELKDLLRPYLEVHEDFVRAQLEVVDRQRGGRSALYREGFGLPDQVIERFIAAAVDPD